jgi:hypothetical protein
VVWTGTLLEWTALQRAKTRSVVTARGRVQFSETGDAGKESAAGERLQRARQCLAGLKGLASIALPSHRVLMRVAELPTIVDSELGEMAALQADKFSPFPVETMTVSHEVLHRNKDSTVVLIAACQQAVVDEVGGFLTPAGVAVGRVDVSALGWCRLLRDAGEAPDEGRHLAVLLAGGVPELILFENGVPRVFRALAGLEALAGEAFEAELVAEINFSLVAAELELGPGPICGVTLWHGEAEPGGVALRLGRELGRKVGLKPLSSLPSLSEGIARRALVRGPVLDLTPASWREAARARAARTRMLTAVAALAGSWLLLVGGFEGWLRVETIALRRLRAQQEAIAGPAAEVRDMRQRVLLVQRYMRREISALEVFRELVVLKPEGLDFTSFTYRREEGAKLSGESFDIGRVYAFKSALDESRLFRSVSLQGPRDEKGKKVFDVDIKLAGDEE